MLVQSQFDAALQTADSCEFNQIIHSFARGSRGSSMLNSRSIVVLLMGILLCVPSVVRAQTKSDEKTDGKKAASPFDVPKNASVEELGRFLESLKTRRAGSRAESEQRILSVYEASSKILDGKAGKPDEKLRVLAADAKLGVLAVMRRVDEKFDGPTQSEFAMTLMQDSNPKIALIGKHFGLVRDAGRLLKMAKGEQASFIEAAFALAKAEGLDAKTFTLLNTNIGRALERDGRYKDAARVYKRLAPMLATSKNPNLVAYQPKMEGAVRRLQLPGNKVELKGTLQNGKPFEWSKYEGKVVLVDFWATWCSPCVAEMPNMKRNYEKYNSKGFEILGVNMDSNRQRFMKFIENRELPWDHITGTKEAFGWDQPIAAHYGISSIPTQMLIGRDGKVIALNLRGKALDRKLEELFRTATP